MNKLRKLILCASAAAPLCWVGRVFSQTFTWTGPASGSFSQAGNWSGGTVPVSGAHILIDGGAAQNSAVTLDIPAVLRTLNVSSGDSFTVAGGVQLEFFGGFPFDANVVNAGTIHFGEAAEITGSTIRFAGGGHVQLSTESNLNLGILLDQRDQVISGTGRVSALGYSVGSNSLLRVAPAPGAAGDAATLQIQLSDIFTNLGRIIVQPGGTFSLRTRELVNSGTIEAMSGATVSFTRDMVIRGGTLSASGNGIIVAAPTSGGGSITLQDVSIAGEFRSDRLRNVFIGQINNSGTITLSAADASISLGGATTTISGGGTLRLTGPAITGAATSTLVNQNHIRGYNQSGAVSVGTLINDGGSIESDVSGRRLTIAPVGALVNSGTLAATNGGELLIGTTPVNIDNRFGRIVARGANSQVKLDRSTTIFGGTIETDTAGEVVFDAPTGTFNLDNVINTGRVRVQSGTLLAGASGVLINGGTITAGHIGLGATITLAGTGQFDVNGTIQNNPWIINLSNRIGGSGGIDRLDNRSGGIVDARGTSLRLISTTKNAGLMRASNGGTLSFSSFSLDNTGGRIEAAAGSHVSLPALNAGTLVALAGGTVTGGFGNALGYARGSTLLGPGVFRPTFGNRFDLNNASISIGDNAQIETGEAAVIGSSTINLVGTNRSVTFKDFAFNVGVATLNFTEGTINLAGTTANRVNLNLQSVRLMPVGVATLSGAGRIFGAGGSSGGGRLVNFDNTIHLDSGSFGLWSGGWENYGTFSGAAAGAILRVPTGSLAINRGVIGGGAANRVDVIGAASALGVLDNAGGAIAAGTNSTVGLFGVTINGGELDARLGTITGVGSLANLTGTSANVVLKDVTMRGSGLRTGPQRFKLQSFTQFADGATMTVGELSEPGGFLYLDFGTLSGSGTVQMMPAGVLSGVGTLNGVSIVGVGAGTLLSLDLAPNSSVIARPVAGHAGEQLLTITTGGIGLRGLLKVESGATMSLMRTSGFAEVVGTGSIVVEAGGALMSQCWIEPGPVTNNGTILMTSRSLFGTNVDGNGTIVLSGGGVSLRRMRQHGLIINAGIASASGVNGPNRLKSLLISGTGTQSLQLSQSSLILDYDGASTLQEIRALITSGYNGGSWNGNGIRVGAAGTNGRRAAGYAEATDIGLANGIFLGEPVDDTTVLIRYTFAGDTDLNGTVNISDFSRLAANFNSPAMWTNGDFNYDGVADISDFSLMASNFNLTLAGDLPALSEVEVPRNAVPEPAMFGAIAAAWAMAGRRRIIQRD